MNPLGLTRFIAISMLFSFSLLGCGGAGQDDAPGAAPQSSAPNQPPPGCRTTLCDLIASGCTDPPTHCDWCRNQCLTAVLPSDFEACENACDNICSLPRDPGPCETSLKTCRASAQNGICADHLGEPAPGGAPCNLDMIKANCACGLDAACYDALDKVNPACKSCNDGWTQKCADQTCTAEQETLDSCMSAHSCSSFTACSPCQAEAYAWASCFNAAQADPRDIGGCYSGSHKCWVDPICPGL